MLKYYIFAFIKANLVVFLIFCTIFVFGEWSNCGDYRFLIWLISNLYFQIVKPSYKAVERKEDYWTWIRITRGKKWYDRYFNEDIRKELKKIK